MTRRVCVAMVVLSGCSLVFTQKPAPIGTPPACATSRVFPIADLVIAGGGVAAGIAAHRDESAHEAAYFGIAGIAVTSAFVGLLRISRCRAAYAMTPLDVR